MDGGEENWEKKIGVRRLNYQQDAPDPIFSDPLLPRAASLLRLLAYNLYL
jgi:hypothetical protein